MSEAELPSENVKRSTWKEWAEWLEVIVEAACHGTLAVGIALGLAGFVGYALYLLVVAAMGWK